MQEPAQVNPVVEVHDSEDCTPHDLASTQEIGPWRLGLDAGSNSLGWAVVLLDETAPEPLVACGVRIFTDRDKAGDETLRNEERRLARQARRQLERRVSRRRRIATILRNAGLLAPESEAIDPYPLRARGLDEPLTPQELGRALYHLGKRRGFKSSRKARKAGAKAEKGEGVVKENIAALRAEMDAAGARTVGEFLARHVAPIDQRRRRRHTDRSMIENEFDLLIAAQRPHHPGVITPEFEKQLRRAIFFQRPLRSAAAFVGSCPLEPGEKRAPRWHWLVQEVRLLQEVNNLRLQEPGAPMRELRQDERARLLDMLHKRASNVNFKDVTKRLRLPEGTQYNLASAHRDKIAPHHVEARLRKIFAERWSRDAEFIRETVWSAFNELEEEEFDRQAPTWQVTPAQADELAKIRAEKGYAAYSLVALAKLLPHLQAGKSLHDARAEAYPSLAPKLAEGLDRVPPADPTTVRNPVVLRILAETRKVVNELIRTFGKPEEIIIELAREARGSVEERKKRMKEQRSNQLERKRILEALAQRGHHNPSGTDIVKYRLWEELGGPDNAHCPYTGKAIRFEALFGESPAFDIEHILPYSRSFDDSFANKTLCEVTENRERKRNRAPAEAYAADPARFEEILQRVRRSKMGWSKRQRFELHGKALEERLERFRTRQLTDTSYAARLLRESLQQLYPYSRHQGAPGALPAVRTSNGVVTDALRRLWGLNGILPLPKEVMENEEAADPNEKHRLDHRHHAVDAIVIALTTPRHIQNLGGRYDGDPAVRFKLPPPWANLRRDTRRKIDRILVSFAPDHKVSGKFAKETNYGQIAHGPHKVRFVHRVDLERITGSQAERILDPTVRAIVKDWLRKRGDRKKLPAMRTRPGAAHHPVIRSVRIWEPIGKPIAMPTADPFRYVEPNGNHHATFFEVPDSRRGKRIVVRVCSLYEAYQRVRRGKEVICRTDDKYHDARFLFSLMINDMVMYRGEDGRERLYRVRSLSPIGHESLDMRITSHIAATIAFDSQTVRLRSYRSPLPFRKVHVDPIGRLFPKKGSVRA